ncbi:hypothetical protein [Haloarcula japonica]|uniref:Uncharacterized protein n=1 Tax=Haloarcula japonica (strain ATCC 49778 / DSM 6131 / JCM 7785 / NBRC 101032 / NCIMB 13157 / TR-1) TaxID=1227453 RepID=M0LFD8_HALJT|nr:hypothetical protein [Haloarcula japonica]EMA30695.1 hypothetical protein C444_09505 [Haloarcula japonica DSM 6131]
MAVWMTAASVASALNIAVLLVLLSVWARNYLAVRSKHALGLTVFGLLLLAENCLSVYYYVLDPEVAVLLRSAAPVAGRAMTFVAILELGGLLFLAWISLD